MSNRALPLPEAVLKAADVLLLVVNRQQQITWANPKVEEHLARSLKELTGHDWALLLVAEGSRHQAHQLVHGLVDSHAGASLLAPSPAASGPPRQILWSARKLQGGENGSEQYLLTGQDLTELLTRQAASATEQRHAAIAELASGMAHEGRNALQQICSCGELLAIELKNHAVAMDLIAGLQDAEARLQRLFDDMRNFTGRWTAQRQQERIDDIWRAAWGQVAPANIHARLMERLLCQPGKLRLASGVLEQAFVKIFQNACEARVEDLEIELVCREATLNHRLAVEISIRDNGPGFSPHSLERAFAPFRTSKPQHSGLGLAIVRQIVEAHGGQAQALNHAEGGACIRLLLPCPD